MADILIVEDESIISMMLMSILKSLGHTVLPDVNSGDKAVAAVEESSPDVVFMDIAMKEPEEGIDASKRIKEMAPATKIVFLTGFPEESFSESLKGVVYDGYLLKPTRMASIRRCLEELGFESASD